MADGLSRAREKITERQSTTRALEIARRIKELRGDQTQAQFAARLGMKQPQLARYERGRIPDREVLAKIARVGGVTVDWLLTGQSSRLASEEAEEPLNWEAALDPVVAGTPLKVQRLHARGGGLDADRAWREMSEQQRDEIRNYLRRAVAVAIAIEHVLPPKPAQAVIDAFSTEIALVLDTKIRDSA